MADTTFNVFHLGTLADIDVDETDTLAENAAALIGLAIGDAVTPLHNLEAPLTLSDFDSDGDAQENDAGQVPDTVTFAGLTRDIDSGVHVTVLVEYTDGSTATTRMVAIQDTDGRLFLAPYVTGAAYNDVLKARPLERIEITGINEDWYSTINTSLENIAYVCFAAGTRVATPGGPRPVERLRPGDLVCTRDHGPQPLRWLAMRRLGLAALAAAPALRPVRVPAGALGPGLPGRDVLLSPQHRVLVRSAVARRMFGAPEVLVPVKALIGQGGIAPAPEVAAVRYVHLLFDGHEIVEAEGAPMESLYLGPEAARAVGPAALAEIAALFGGEAGARAPAAAPLPARPLAGFRRGQRLAARHRAHAIPLVSAGA